MSPLVMAAADPMGHVLDKVLIGPLPGLESLGPAMTMNTLTMIVAAVLAVVALMSVAKSVGTGPESQGNERYLTKGRFAQVIEVVVLYLRDKVIYPQLGESMGRRFAPLLLTLFFFILFNNLLGLVPLLDIQHLIGTFFGDSHFAIIGGTATGRLAVTAGLAVTVFIIWQVNGIIESGVGGWAKHFLGGGPWYLAPIMLPVEIMGMIVKPVALALRLFANMTAGHVLLAVLLGFTSAAPAALGVLFGAPVGIVALFASVAIMFLELFVAFLQAFIFMFLTTLFIAQLAHHHHDEHAHDAGHGADHHDHAHGHAAPVAATA